MNIEVFASYTHFNEKDVRGKTALVVETLRTTSTMVTALANGCAQIIPVEDVEEAMELKASMKEAKAIVGGERGIRKLMGFDYGNSPLEYTQEAVTGKTLIMTATEGTKAIAKAGQANTIYIGSLINGVTAASALLRSEGNAVIICAGVEGRLALGDIMTAGYIIYRMKRFGASAEINLDDMGMVCERLYENSREELGQALADCDIVKKLKHEGFDKDIDYCLKRDTVRLLPVCRDGRITV